MAQYAFPLTLPPVFSEDNFYAAPCNRESHAWVTRWPNWPSQALLVYGPSGAGKSHLGHIWAGRAKGKIFFSREQKKFAPETMSGNWLIEDIEKLADEKALFHLLNLAKENKNFLLLTASLPPRELPFTLPDLTSRLLALPCVGIAAPDEETIAAVLRKQFSDRQLKVEDEVIAFLLPRMERSYGGAATIVETLDKQALAEQRNLTVPFVKRTLGY